MRIFKKAAASTVAVGPLAFAATAQPLTASSATIGGIALGLFPNCTAGDSTID